VQLPPGNWFAPPGSNRNGGLKDRLILELDMTDALRPSELLGLRWLDLNYDECLLVLRETVYRSKLRNWGKTRKALRPIHIPKELADDLWLWRQESNHPEPEGFIFPNRLRKGGFIDPQNYRRKMRKLDQELELPKLTFQVIRRTIATLAQKKGTPKDIQGVLRHSRLSTTTDVYMQEIPDSVKATVGAINKELRLKPCFVCTRSYTYQSTAATHTRKPFFGAVDSRRLLSLLVPSLLIGSPLRT